MTAKPFTAIGNGVRIAVRLTPRGGGDRVEGVDADAEGRPILKIRLSAPPVDGAANEALTGFLAKALGVRKKDVVIRSGQAGRKKILEVAGDPAALTARLERLV